MEGRQGLQQLATTHSTIQHMTHTTHLLETAVGAISLQPLHQCVIQRPLAAATAAIPATAAAGAAADAVGYGGHPLACQPRVF